MATREGIISSARRLVNVPWKHLGRNREVGIDCIGALIVVAIENGLLVRDVPVYPMRPDGKTLVDELSKRLIPIEPKEQAKEADVVVTWYGQVGVPQHVGILTGSGKFVHTYRHTRKVVEVTWSEWWKARWTHTFRFPGLEN